MFERSGRGKTSSCWTTVFFSIENVWTGKATVARSFACKLIAALHFRARFILEVTECSCNFCLKSFATDLPQKASFKSVHWLVHKTETITVQRRAANSSVSRGFIAKLIRFTSFYCETNTFHVVLLRNNYATYFEVNTIHCLPIASGVKFALQVTDVRPVRRYLLLQAADSRHRARLRTNKWLDRALQIKTHAVVRRTQAKHLDLRGARIWNHDKVWCRRRTKLLTALNEAWILWPYPKKYWKTKTSIAMGVGRVFSRGSNNGCFYGGSKVVKFHFTTRN